MLSRVVDLATSYSSEDRAELPLRLSIVPTYAADLRRLINDDFSTDPFPDIQLLGGSLAVRLRDLESARRSIGNRRIACAAEGLDRATDDIINYAPAEFFVRSLSHRWTISGVIFHLLARQLPLDLERRVETHLLRIFRQRYAELLLPRPILELVEAAAASLPDTALVRRLETVRLAVYSSGVSLETARDRRDRIRADAVIGEGLSDGLNALQTSALEFYSDFLLLQRGVREDLRRCEAAAIRNRTGVAREFAILDRAADLHFERILAHVLGTAPVLKHLGAPGPDVTERETVKRVPYHRYGLLDRETRRKAEEVPQTESAHTAFAQNGGVPREEPGSATPTLDRLGVDLTEQASRNQLPAVVGRETELDGIIEVLCRRTKRNPLLVGPAGTGKTALVSGLAGRIAAGLVPTPLLGLRVVELQVASLLAGSQTIGDIEDRVLPIVEEASRTRTIVFFDEIHQIVGAGAYRNNDNDIAQILKPALARGELAVIGATTPGEYRHYIAGDAAFERRFQVIDIREPGREATLAILRSVRTELSRESGIQIGEDLLPPLIRLSSQAFPGRHLPDRAIDLLEMAAARVVASGGVRVTAEILETSARILTGLPEDVDARLETLRTALIGDGLMVEEDAAALVGRLRVTLRGLALNPARPRAVLEVPGDPGRATAIAEALCRDLGEGGPAVISADIRRVLTLDDLENLLGGRRGHRSSSDSPLQRACRLPGSVLVLRNLEEATESVRRIFLDALGTGRLLDAAGGELRMGGTIVLLTSERSDSLPRQIGFSGSDRTADFALDVRAVVDVIARMPPSLDDPHRRRSWVERVAIPRIAALLQERGIHPPAVAELLALVATELGQEHSIAAVDRLVEQTLLPRLLRPRQSP